MEFNKEDMKKVEISLRIRQGAKLLLKRLKDYGVIPEKPKFQIGKRLSEKQVNELYLYTIYKQAFDDAYFLESFLLEEEMLLIWDEEEIKGKKYKTLKLVPKQKGE